MKKGFIAFLLVSVMALSFSVPAMAANAVVTETINAEMGQENSIHSEVTQIVWRTYNGVLQFRVWSVTFGRWNTDWTNLNLL